MVADPLLLKAGSWLAIAGDVLLVLTVLAFVWVGACAFAWWG